VELQHSENGATSEAAPSPVLEDDQLVELLVVVWAGHVCPVVLGEVEALGVGLAAKTLATPQALSAPATTTAATAALMRDRLGIASGTRFSGISRFGSMPTPFKCMCSGTT
jgi:hypothetical protein